jgi:hypothetical protein
MGPGQERGSRLRAPPPAGTLTGRFTQQDPIGIAGGLNLYGFANGDPVNFSDPFGLCATDVEERKCPARSNLGGNIWARGGFALWGWSLEWGDSRRCRRLQPCDPFGLSYRARESCGDFVFARRLRRDAAFTRWHFFMRRAHGRLDGDRSFGQTGRVQISILPESPRIAVGHGERHASRLAISR